MLRMNKDLEDALTSYLDHLDQGEYFDAHEVLEEGWHPLRLRRDPLANLVKGLINGAIAFEHLKRNRKRARERAIKVLGSYERYKPMINEEIAYYPLFLQSMQKIEQLKEEHQLSL
jgi:predicted metal-dependent hydrolase